MRWRWSSHRRCWRRCPADKREALLSVLAQDPRPGYLQEDARRVYGVPFAGLDVKFRVEGQRLIVCGLETVG